MLRTPSVIEGEGGASSAALKKANGNMLMLRDQMADLVVDNGMQSTVALLLPTPNTMDGLPAREGDAYELNLRRGDPNGSRREMSGNLREVVIHNLLPTVTTQDASNTGGPSQGLRNTPPSTISPILLPTPVASEGLKAPSQQNSETKAKTGQVWLSNIAKDIQENND